MQKRRGRGIAELIVGLIRQKRRGKEHFSEGVDK